MSDAKLGSGVSSDPTTESCLPEILNAHARMETQCGEIYVQFAATFGQYPVVHANHDANRENLYWGTARVDLPLIRAIYRLTLRCPDEFDGHVVGSPFWWGDLAQSHVRYVRNLTFESLNVGKINPTLPYRDPRRPLVNWWFSAADAEHCDAFNHLLRSSAQDALEREGGIAIVATHFSKGFVTAGRLNPDTQRLLEEMSRRPGWFVPVGELLDWLRGQGVAGQVPAAEWSRMQWRWLWDLIRRAVADRLQRSLARLTTPRDRGTPQAPQPRDGQVL